MDKTYVMYGRNKLYFDPPAGWRILTFATFKDNPEVGTAGIYEKYARISFVCYLREKIISCPDDIDPRFLTKSGHSKIITE